MKDLLSKLTVLSLIAAGGMIACTGALAQQVRMAEAVHKGTYNYLRVAPDTHSHMIMKMRQGTRFEVTGKQGDFYSVILANGTRGWTYVTNVHFL